MILRRWLVLLCLVLFPCVASATTVPTPTTLAGGGIVTAKEAKTLLDTKAAVFYDARRNSRFVDGHLNGATNLPYVQNSVETASFDATLDQFNLSALPTNKAATIVFYSNSNNGWKSYKAALLAIRQGYTNVRWLRDGVAGWSAAGYTLVK